MEPRIRLPNRSQNNLYRPSIEVKKSIWKNEEFILGVIVGVLGLIGLELVVLLLYGFVGAIISVL